MDEPAERAVEAARRWTVALVVPAAAAGLQLLLWPILQPLIWVLFYPAIFVTSRYAGLRGGIVSTLWSVALAGFFFVPPRFSVTDKPPQFLWQSLVFFGMGILFSVTHERLRAAKLEAARALAATDAANQGLVDANLEVTRLLEQTRELDRLKTNFFSTVSHELRTPLALILGPVERRLADAGLAAEVRSELELVQRNARLLHRHVDELLEVSKLQAGRGTLRFARVDLSRLLPRVASLFDALAAERRIRFTVEAPPSVVAELDEEKLERILVNLLGNAFKFADDGGAIALTLSLEAGRARVCVDDSGPGVPAELRTAIFEPFRQADGGASRARGGTGLGLAIVKDLVELHAGTIAVTSAPLGGARFEVTLPLQAPAGVAVAGEGERGDGDALGRQIVAELQLLRRPRAPDGPGAAGLPHLLVVDDQPDMLEFVASTFGARYRISTARDGREGLERALALQPDLVISDVMMPGMTGDELVRELRGHRSFDDVPILLLTAKADDALRLQMLQHGAQDYLAKPFSSEELLARVDGLLAVQQRARASLRDVTARLEAHLQNSPLAVVEFDRTFRITRWAGRAERVFGWSSAQAVGRSSAELALVHAEDQPRIDAFWAAMVDRRERSTQLTNRNLRRDGGVITCEWYNSAVFDPSGQLVSVLSLALDVTARDAAERQLLGLYAQAQSDVATKSRLLMEVNHRVKNNLLSLLGMMHVEQRLVASAGERLDGTSFDRFRRRVEALLAAHELLSGSEWAAPLVSRLASTSVGLALEASGMAGRTRLSIAPSSAVVSPRQAGALSMILNELATNSAKHAGPSASPLEVEVTATIAGDTLLVRYRDAGAGYSAEALRGERLGVGLRLLRELTEGMLRGTLQLSNDGGAVAELRVPVEEPHRT